MPRNRALLDLDLAARRALRVVLEDLEHLAHPAHVQLLREVAPPLLARLPYEAPMLRRHPQVRDVPQMLLEELPVAPRDDVHDVARVRRERLERLQRVRRRHRRAGDLHDGRERPVVVEEEQPLARRGVVPLELVLGDEGRATRHVRAAEALEQLLREHRRPRVRGVRGDGLVQLLVAARLLVLGHRQAAVHRRSDLLQAVRTLVSRTSSEQTAETENTYAEVPRVDLERLGHVARDAHELGEDERALLRALLRDHKLHRCRVHPVTEWGDHAEIRNRQQRIELVLLDRLVAVPNIDQLAIARLPPNPPNPLNPRKEASRNPRTRLTNGAQG